MAHKVLLKKSSVATKVPTTSDLDYGELALNYADGKIFYKTASNTIGEFTSGASGTGTVTSVGLTVPTGLSVSGSPITTTGTIAISLTTGYSIPTTTSQTNWDSAYSERYQWDGGSTNLVAATGRTSLGATTVGSSFFTLVNPSAITFPRINANNTISALTASAFRTAIGAGTSSTTGTVTSVGGTGTVSGLTLSGTVTTSGNLTLGGTLAVTPSNFASQTANTVLAAPNGTSGTPTFRSLVAADIPTLNQNTTGTASNVTGTVAIANGGTGATTRQDAMDALAGAVTSGQYLRGNGLDVVMSTIQAADVPTLNQNTTGTASNVTGTVAIANGGTGATTAADALTSLGAYAASNPNGYTSNTGTVTSISMTVPTGLSISGSPITSSGTLALTLSAGYSIPTTTSQTNWDTAYTDRNKWDGGSTGLVAATGRTSLGSTTLGDNLFTIANVATISFPRFNADNTVSSLDAATFRTAIGAGTSSTTGTVTSVGGTGTVSGLTLSGTVTTSGNLTLGGTLAVTPSNFASQTANTVLAAPNGTSGTPTFRSLVAADIPTLNQNTTGTASNVTGTVAVANGGTGSTTLTSNAVLLGNATSAVQTVSPGSSGNVLTSNGSTWISSTPATSGVVTAIASGSLSNGTKVILNADGTVSAVTTIAGSPVFGTSVQYSTDTSVQFVTAVYASNLGKVIVTSKSSIYVGTVSGSTITFGSAAYAAYDITSSAYDPINQVVVFTYLDVNSYGVAVAGSISGTTLTLGTPVIFNSSTTGLTKQAVSYDPLNSCMVFGYMRFSGSFTVQGVVATLSGTIITFQTAVQVSGGSSTPHLVYDSINSKTIFVYGQVSAVAITVSGTTLTVGTSAFRTAGATYAIREIIFDPLSQKVLILGSASGVGKIVVTAISGSTVTLSVVSNFSVDLYSAEYNNTLSSLVLFYYNGTNTVAAPITVSDTGITAGTESIIRSGTSLYSMSVYDSTNQRIVYAYKNSNETYPRAIVATQSAGTNLNGSNYLGISNAAYANGATATIQVDGSIDDAQNGLTAGSTYYVANNGSLSTTNNGIKVGQALNSTTILLNRALSGPEINAYLGSLI